MQRLKELMKSNLELGKELLNVTAKEVSSSFFAISMNVLRNFKSHSYDLIDASPDFYKNYKPAKSSVSSHTRPVLLVHGIAHNASAFIRMKIKMKKEGFLHVFTMSYKTLHGDFLEMVEELALQVEKVIEVTGSAQIDIVAHSLGGIVARYYMSFGSGKGKVKNLITLGTAHKGTYLSPFLKVLSLKSTLPNDLYAGSSFLKKLQQAAIAKGSTVTSIYSKYDLIIWPQSHCFAEGTPQSAFKNIKLDSVGHIGLLYSSLVFQYIIEALKH